MKTYVCTMQQENWEDDGGDHDPFIIQVSDEEGQWLESFVESASLLPGRHINEDDKEEMEMPYADMVLLIRRSKVALPWSLPITIDGILAFWCH